MLCRHTDVHDAARHSGRDTTGATLRALLYESLSCLVENYLFSRTTWRLEHPESRLLEAIEEDDFDVIIVIFYKWNGCFPDSTDYNFGASVYKNTGNARSLTFLLSVHTPHVIILHMLVEYWSMAGELEMLKVLRDTQNIPEIVVGDTICRLRGATRSSMEVSTTSLRNNKTPSREDLYVILAKMDAEAESLRSSRKECLQLLIAHRDRSESSG